jgi:hypothetical protein
MVGPELRTLFHDAYIVLAVDRACAVWSGEHIYENTCHTA